MVRLKLNEVLKERGISMGRLARLSDVSFSTIRRICNDPSYSPSLNVLERISRALNVNISELYDTVPD